MFKTFLGVTEDAKSEVYLRPETAQGIFVNFKNVMRTARKKIPFGIGQIGKSFRNEITPGNFIFRTREFEQMELSFLRPGTDMEWYEYWIDFCKRWLLDLGMKPENIRTREHSPGGAFPLQQSYHRYQYCSLRVGRIMGNSQPHRLRSKAAC